MISMGGWGRLQITDWDEHDSFKSHGVRLSKAILLLSPDSLKLGCLACYRPCGTGYYHDLIA